MDDGDIVRAGTRRIVGRTVLRRLDGMVREWQAEEKARSELAGRLALALLVAAALALALFQWFYR